MTHLNRVHQSINAAHLTMFLNDRIDEETATRLKSIDGVVEVEPLNEVSVRYKLRAEDEWQPDVNLDYQFDLQAVLIWLVMVVVIAALASVIPARNAVTISVRESLAYA